MPQHIAIIMDGNGRWAEQRNLLRFEGHRAGMVSVRTTVKCCLEQGIPVLSLFAFSSENWRRPVAEVEFLMALFIEALQKESEQLEAQGIQLRFLGALDELSPNLQEQMKQAEQITSHNTQLILNLAVNYGGQWDIMAAVKKVAEKVLSKELTLESLTESIFTNYLSTQALPHPDLFIRTSGEKRISNFFLWQLAYTELYFSDIHWPDFTEVEFKKALTSFQERERRFGKTSQQVNEETYV